jgi:prefoldin subunit 5
LATGISFKVKNLTIHTLKHTTLILAIAIFTLVSCNDRKAIETLEKATMDLHDEAMKSMGDMNAVASAIRAALPGVDSLSPRYDSLQTAVRTIKKAEADMMDWMQQYNSPAEDMPIEAATSYLNDQKAKMAKNLQDIQAALAQGQSALGK